IKNGYKVEMINDNVDEFHVFLEGPPNSLYSEGVWKVTVKLPADYPSKPPAIAFKTTIYHPNIHSMQVRLDLLMVFDYFLPQLLMTPNAEHPLNKEAAALLMSDKANYEATVKVEVVPDVEPSASPSSGNEAMAVVLVWKMRQWLQFVFPH
ncbi:ubiquitin-conjugating enzyme E2 5, partial [Tanacetum coccineum]